MLTLDDVVIIIIIIIIIIILPPCSIVLLRRLTGNKNIYEEEVRLSGEDTGLGIERLCVQIPGRAV